MPVLLHRSDDLLAAFDRWATLDEAACPALDSARRVEGLGAELEAAFETEAGNWLDLARTLGRDASAVLAHAPSAAANVSDLGLMMAWTRLVRAWGRQPATTLFVCDDPWMFRHLMQCDGVVAGGKPPLTGRRLALWLRGYAARSRVALRMARNALAWRPLRRRLGAGDAVLLVYGHPSSTADGFDGYFGDLMRQMPKLKRALHVDGSATVARSLCRDGRTLSLHAFGNPLKALALIFAKWRPSAEHRQGTQGWLVRRAAAMEGGSGQAAMVAWQDHCQGEWLKSAPPAVVAWPWENHGWERALARRLRALGVNGVGYQHSVVGRQMLNYGPGSNPDGAESLPQRILTAGEATLKRLMAMGVPQARLTVAGSLRFPRAASVAHDPDGPVYVALPFDPAICRQMIAACRQVRGRRFLVKAHPMYPFDLPADAEIARTEKTLDQCESLSCVLYAATTVGLEAVLAGLPTLRFQPHDRIAMDILPDHVNVPAVSAEGLQDALEKPTKPGIFATQSLFGPVAMGIWQELLTTHD